jgi:hypothetical protein
MYLMMVAVLTETTARYPIRVYVSFVGRIVGSHTFISQDMPERALQHLIYSWLSAELQTELIIAITFPK